MAAANLFHATSVNQTGNWTDCFTVSTSSWTFSSCVPSGSQTAQLQGFIDRFEALTTCGSGELTCDANLACTDGACLAPSSCICPQIYQPVCGTNGTTYGNSCAAGCASATVAHTGACGIAGDTCGTIRGLTCADGFKCRFAASTYDYPYPDAGGTCVAQNYCDKAADCNGQPAPATPGSWSCASNTCNWLTGPQWKDLPGFAFETAHPYAANQATWSDMITLPDGATKLRLVPSGTFNLESGYDFLEVWTWNGSAWVKSKRYTGTVGPAATDTFTGTYFYLKFVSDVSVQNYGFKVTAQSQ
jgi:hypothetical protein